MRHLLVTNDFPPKIGGIQAYLWELWRRLPAGTASVLTTPHRGAAAFDRAQRFPIERTIEPVLLPNPVLAAHIRRRATAEGAEHVMLDPALPLGFVGPGLGTEYGVVLHGAEVTVPGRLPGTRQALGKVLRGASRVIAAGSYAAAEGERAAGRSLPVTVVPPGVDVDRFRPLSPSQRSEARRRLGLPADAFVVLSVSRLVPRKGMDLLVRAAARLAPRFGDLIVAIGGVGRDRRRLDRLIRETRAPVRMMGRVPADHLPALYGSADLFTMLCRTRWAGLEQEGFGIVFVEAAAAGIPALAGRSGGSHEAVRHGETGAIVDEPWDLDSVTSALAELITDDRARTTMAVAARARAEREFSYDVLARRLAGALGAESPS